ncbi:hypothetical protein EBZ39_13230, partial [bacterium]|nr:hypothetical protein [bacterium]
MLEIKDKYGTEFVFKFEIDIDNMEDVECEVCVFFQPRSRNIYLYWPPEEDVWELSRVKLTDDRSDGRELDVAKLDEHLVEQLIGVAFF